MTCAPIAVSVAPPRFRPPVSVATAGLHNMPLTDFTNCQAVRYEISSERAAADIEPFASMASSSAIVVGPSIAPFAKIMRMRRRGIAMNTNKNPYEMMLAFCITHPKTQCRRLSVESTHRLRCQQRRGRKAHPKRSGNCIYRFSCYIVLWLAFAGPQRMRSHRRCSCA